jgi:mRNA-degrading endonuclease RelE of RelBE toxin-antitoxin system
MILKSFFEPEFKKYSKKLPPGIREKATKAFKKFREHDDFSRGLNFERIKGHDTLYSIRIDDNYRALGHKLDDTMYWYWIGPHDEYMRRIRN